MSERVGVLNRQAFISAWWLKCVFHVVSRVGVYLISRRFEVWDYVSRLHTRRLFCMMVMHSLKLSLYTGSMHKMRQTEELLLLQACDIVNSAWMLLLPLWNWRDLVRTAWAGCGTLTRDLHICLTASPDLKQLFSTPASPSEYKVNFSESMDLLYVSVSEMVVVLWC